MELGIRSVELGIRSVECRVVPLLPVIVRSLSLANEALAQQQAMHHTFVMATHPFHNELNPSRHARYITS